MELREDRPHIPAIYIYIPHKPCGDRARSIRRKPTAECICEGSSVRSSLPPSDSPCPRPGATECSCAPVSCRDSTADKTVASDAARMALTPFKSIFHTPVSLSLLTDAVWISPDQTAAGVKRGREDIGCPLKQNLLPDKVRIFSASLYPCIKAGLSIL